MLLKNDEALKKENKALKESLKNVDSLSVCMWFKLTLIDMFSYSRRKNLIETAYGRILHIFLYLHLKTFSKFVLFLVKLECERY